MGKGLGGLAALMSLSTGLLFSAGCTPKTKLGGDDYVRPVARARVRTTQGSSIAVTQDERIAVVANRIDGIVTVLRIDPARPADDLVLEKRTEIAFHPLNTSQPWQVVIAPDDDTAYVLVRGAQKVVQLVDLHADNPHLSELEAHVGSEPTAMLISPSGKMLYVANSGEGTLSMIVTKDLGEARVDLNARLLSDVPLGPILKNLSGDDVWTDKDLEDKKRPGLAHPRALAMTDDGDDVDSDEVVYATEFFSQPSPGAPDDPDLSRQGIVYPILPSGQAFHDKAQRPVNTISLAPVADTGFKDAEGNVTGCFPNQLYGAAVSGTQLFVTAVCASPKGPVEAGPDPNDPNAANNFKTLVHAAVFVVDTSLQAELPAQRLLLNKELEALYEPGAPNRRMPLLPTSITFAQDSAQAYVTAFGASAVFPIDFATTPPTPGTAAARFINLGETALPTGVATLSNGMVLIADDRGPALAVGMAGDAMQAHPFATVQRDYATDPDTEKGEIVSDQVKNGRRLFATGLRVWSAEARGFSSCESCHPEGLSDGVTWRFVRGPRRSISLAGTYYKDDPTRRLLLWTANLDEIHDLEGVARALSGGAGGVVWNPYAGTPSKDCRLLYDGKRVDPTGTSLDCASPKRTKERRGGLNGSLAAISAKQGEQCLEGDGPRCDLDASRDWDDIDAFVRSIRAPAAPTTLDRKLVSDGEVIFNKQGCPACHGGPGWTIARLFYEPNLENNGAAPFDDPHDPKVEGVATYVPDDETGLTWLGALRNTAYHYPETLPPGLNPPAKTGYASFRPGPQSDRMGPQLPVLDFLYPKSGALPDQINCALRAVGTFPVQDPPVMGVAQPANYKGVTPADAPPIWEGRHVVGPDPKSSSDPKPMIYLDQLATGGLGFNIPSLVGLSAGAPYFHAGNARSLEELLRPTFRKHYNARYWQGDSEPVPQDPTRDEIKALVSYLLSIDESDDVAPPVKDPSADLCAQYTGH